MKESCGGERFENNDVVKEYVHNWLTMHSQTFLEQEMLKLPNRLQNVLSVQEAT